jgi:hypothetical protein
MGGSVIYGVRAFCERTALRKLLYNFYMPHYRRSYYGSIYFFPVVIYPRRPILTSEAARTLFHSAWIDVQNRYLRTGVIRVFVDGSGWYPNCPP